MTFARTTSLSLPALVLFLACAGAGIKRMDYGLQPERIEDPQAEVLRFINLNTTQGCITEPAFDDRVLLVKFACNNGVGNSTARLDRVKEIALEQYEEWYRVVVRHSDGSPDFAWSSKSLEDVQRAADAFAALSGAGPTRRAPANNTTL